MDRRAVAAILGLVGLALVALVLLTRGGGGSDAAAASDLRVELNPIDGGFDMVVYAVPGAVARPGPRVVVECVDDEGEVVIAWRERWPFDDTDGGLLDPHAHRPVTDAMGASVDACRIRARA